MARHVENHTSGSLVQHLHVLRRSRLKAAAACLLWLAAGAAAWSDEQARVVRAVDGDTIEVRVLQTRRLERVRLIGVSAPELKGDQPFSRESRQYLRELVGGEPVNLVSDHFSADRDKYGRLLRYVVLPWGLDANAEMIRTGHARLYPNIRFNKLDEYRKLEVVACNRKAGGWGAGAGWGPCALVVPGPRPSAEAGTPNVYVTRSGGKYHTADCPTLKGAGMLMPLTQAIAAGLKPCKRCSPRKP